METHSQALTQAIELNRAVQPAEAYERVVGVITAAAADELLAMDPLLTAAIESFLPKRRRALRALLAVRLAEPSDDGIALLGAESAAQPADDSLAGGQEARGPVDDKPSDELTPALSRPEHQGTGQRETRERAEVSAALRRVKTLLRSVQLDSAEKEMLAELDQLPPDLILSERAEIQSVIELFLPRRRRSLLDTLKSKASAAEQQKSHSNLRNASQPGGDVECGDAVITDRMTQEDELDSQLLTRAATPKPIARPPGQKPQFFPDYNRKRFSEDLNWLSHWHIFKWNTQYRDTLSEYFDSYFDELCVSTSGEKERAILDLIRSALSNHSREIFTKGFSYSFRSPEVDDQQAFQKQLTGLRRFLEIPIEIYSTKVPGSHQNATVKTLRPLASAMIFGIIAGFSWADLGTAKNLYDYPEFWCFALPFLTYRDMQELIGHLFSGPSALNGVRDSALPLAEAIDTFIEKQPTVAPLPALSEYSITKVRLDMTLHLSPSMSTSRQLYVRCHLTDDEIQIAEFEDASVQQFCIVLANLSGEVRAHVANIQRLSDMVIPTGGAPETDLCRRIINNLDDAIYKDQANAGPTRPIVSNPAREFPIENPFLAKYQHVYRKSVRQLMSTFERRNGVRLWCSVRRSGKTTACAKDLGSISEDSVFLAQSCSSTGQIDAGDIFYSGVVSAIRGKVSIDDDFVVRTLRSCVDQMPAADKRMIVVLDEYEILFGHLNAMMRTKPELRYTVVQPLLDQLVAFARENLLVFMGQQPAAHYIMMDQNQLSPMVVQDAFPLFSHDPKSQLETSEFWQLLRKLLRTSSDPDPEFINAVYEMTGGHPYLTVNMVVALLDWMIEQSFPRSSLNPLSAETFHRFITEQLTSKFIARGEHFNFFKRAAASALSPDGRQSDPWLHAVYSVLRSIHLESPSTHSLTEMEFEEAVTKSSPGIDPQDLLGTAIQSNFLMHQRDVIRPRIQMLSRIAGSVSTGGW